jgi:glycosyltransferase involved in cell wall biosynthesis
MKIVTFAPEVIHYIPGPSIRSFILIKALSIIIPKSIAVISASRPVLSKLCWGIIPLLKPDLMLVQSSKYWMVFKKLGFRIAFFGGGVDTKRFCPPLNQERKKELRKKFRVPNNKFVVIHVGHISRMRSLEVFEEIAKIDNLFVYIVAATSWIKPDDKILSGLKRAGCLINTDFLSEIETVYQMADCYVFPGFSASPSIEIPLSVLEAMACNIPVVAGRFGGLNDLFSQRDGFYFADNNDGILQSVEKIFHSSSSSVNTRKMVEAFSWKSLRTKLIKIYSEVIDEKQRIKFEK